MGPRLTQAVGAIVAAMKGLCTFVWSLRSLLPGFHL